LPPNVMASFDLCKRTGVLKSSGPVTIRTHIAVRAVLTVALKRARCGSVVTVCNH